MACFKERRDRDKEISEGNVRARKYREKKFAKISGYS